MLWISQNPFWPSLYHIQWISHTCTHTCARTHAPPHTPTHTHPRTSTHTPPPKCIPVCNIHGSSPIPLQFQPPNVHHATMLWKIYVHTTQVTALRWPTKSLSWRHPSRSTICAVGPPPFIACAETRYWPSGDQLSRRTWVVPPHWKKLQNLLFVQTNGMWNKQIIKSNHISN